MKFKNLLSLGAMLSCGLVAQAQVVYESFDSEQTKSPTDAGYYEYINFDELDSHNLTEDGFKNGAMSISNSSEATMGDPTGNYKRAIKLRNLNLQDGKSYRITFYAKGKEGNNVHFSLQQGTEYCDKALIDANGKEQVSDFKCSDEWKRVSAVVNFPSKEAQDAYFDEKCKDNKDADGNPSYKPEYKELYFLTLNAHNHGDYQIDEVKVEESYHGGVTYSGQVICIDPGYATNIKELVGDANYVFLEKSLVKVTCDGEEAEIETVEGRPDGKIYVFLADEASGEVNVTFTNDGTIQYTDGAYITGDMLGIAENAEEDTTMDEMISSIYEEPSVVEMTPEDGMFNLNNDISEFTITFDKNVLTVADDDFEYDGPVATLSDGSTLSVKAGTEKFTDKVTFVRGGAPLADGVYKLVISNIMSEYGTLRVDDIPLTFEVGKVKVSETILTPAEGGDYKTQAAGEGAIPDNWTVTLDGNEHGGGSGTRAFMYTNSNMQSALYMRDWEGKAVATRTFTAPAGKIALRNYSAGWGTSGTLIIKVTDAAGTEVVNQEVVVSKSLEKNRQGNFQADDILFETEGGEFTYSVQLKDGSNELLAGGFELLTVTITEGQKVETETLAEGNFAATQSDWMPAYGSGWKIYRAENKMRTPGSNGNWGGTCWTGGGGPRVKSMGNKGMNGAAIYLGGNCYATYGEYLTPVDAQTREEIIVEGVEAENTLDLDIAKYNFTYYIINWKTPGEEHFIQLDIYKQEDGINGTPVYTRKDGVSESCGSANDSSKEAKKINFFWNCPDAGKYILKFTASGPGEGECCIGNVTVETTNSLAVQYADMMNKEIKEPIAQLEKADSDEKYQGSTREALRTLIADSKAAELHTVAEYEEAFAELKSLTKQLGTRCDNVDRYPVALQEVEDGLNAAKGTKYEGLEQFPLVEDAYNTYKDQNPTFMEDQSLQDAVDVMGTNGAVLKSMVEVGVPLLTKQAVDLAAAIVKLDEETQMDVNVIGAGNLIQDDQSLVDMLKTLYASKMYKKIAAGFNFTEKVEIPEEGEETTETLGEDEIPVEIPVSFLIQNANFYNLTQIPEGKENEACQLTDFPGWEIEAPEGQRIQSLWSRNWGQVGATPTNPVYDCAVCTPHGTGTYTVKQTVDFLPVAKYKASIIIASDRVNDDTANNPELDFTVNDITKRWECQSTQREWDRDDNVPTEIEEVEPIIAGNYGEITISADMKKACFGKVDNATLTMVGKADGFDYETAAKALEEEYAAGIENAPAAPEGAPASVKYYNLNGAQVKALNGVGIKVEQWANGYTRISKVVNK